MSDGTGFGHGSITIGRIAPPAPPYLTIDADGRMSGPLLRRLLTYVVLASAAGVVVGFLALTLIVTVAEGVS